MEPNDATRQKFEQYLAAGRKEEAWDSFDSLYKEYYNVLTIMLDCDEANSDAIRDGNGAWDDSARAGRTPGELQFRIDTAFRSRI